MRASCAGGSNRFCYCGRILGTSDPAMVVHLQPSLADYGTRDDAGLRTAAVAREPANLAGGNGGVGRRFGSNGYTEPRGPLAPRRAHSLHRCSSWISAANRLLLFRTGPASACSHLPASPGLSEGCL